MKQKRLRNFFLSDWPLGKSKKRGEKTFFSAAKFVAGKESWESGCCACRKGEFCMKFDPRNCPSSIHSVLPRGEREREREKEEGEMETKPSCSFAEKKASPLPPPPPLPPAPPLPSSQCKLCRKKPLLLPLLLLLPVLL